MNWVRPLWFSQLKTQSNKKVYPLPEAQLDRFMLMIHVGYPTQEEEIEVVRRTTYGDESDITAVLDPERLLNLQRQVRELL